MGTQRVQMNGVLPWLVRWTRRAGTIDIFFCLGCSSQPSTKYYFLTAHFFTLLVPIALQPGYWAGRRAGSPVSGLCRDILCLKIDFHVKGIDQ
jgi:hypothetical protein